jgi:hypothetical protein
MPANEGGRGNIAGFESTCPKCGLVMRNSTQSGIDSDVAGHAVYHEKRDKR